MKRLLTTAVAAFTMLTLASCSDSTSTPVEPSPSETAVETPTPEPEPTPEIVPTQITILGGGDVLTHEPINNAARQADGSYDFTQFYTHMGPWIENADIALCTLEVPIMRPGDATAGYPMFAGAYELAQDLADVGYDGCSLAGNHAMDRGMYGVTSTIEALTEAGMGWAGTARTQEEADETQFYVLESGGREVYIAHLSYTTLTNGIPIPPEAPYSWDVVGDLGAPIDTIITDAQVAREAGADLVVVSMQWGTEYVSEPIAEQYAIAEQLAESGEIDLIFGTHPHVPQGIVELEGGPRGEGMWVAWSMGNQLSNQSYGTLGDWRVGTGLVTIARVDVPVEGPATVASLDWMGVTVDEKAGYQLYPLWWFEGGYIPEGSGISTYDAEQRMTALYPVMAESGEQLTEELVPVADSLTVMRK
ncbi:MAG: CapA family protein [Actinomycetaceae bacterium]|nr:CapA family protein [Actinomycetaceae bacterium]